VILPRLRLGVRTLISFPPLTLSHETTGRRIRSQELFAFWQDTAGFDLRLR
jgi:hypothetical protein